MFCPNCQTSNPDGVPNCGSCGRILKLGLGTVLAGRYEIQKLLGQGGMGTVYKAHDRSLDETVAVKVLRPEMIGDEDAARRFLAEIKTARKIAHRNVCRIYEYGEDHGLRFISMAYVEGVDLKVILREAGALPWPEAFEVAIRVAEALQAIHEEGIVHRDLKTPNIMRDQKGVVRVMDFGIAKDVQGAGMTQTGMIMGTPEYMSPEQATGTPLDFRSDLYALGVVVFELFTGTLPFRSETPLRTLMMHIQEPPPLDGPEAESIPAAILPVLRRLLAKAAADRYDSTELVVQALKQARTDTLGVGTGPVSPTAATVAVTSSSTPTPAVPMTAASPVAAPPPLPPPWAPPPPSPPPLPVAPSRSKLPWVLGGLALLGMGFMFLVVVGLFFAGSTVPEASSSPVPASGPGFSPTPTREPAAGPTAPPANTTDQAPPDETTDDNAPTEGAYVQSDDDAEPAEEEPAADTQAVMREWRVAHDHGDAFQSFCIGKLYLVDDVVGFRGQEHRFQVDMASVKEIERNGVYGANFGAFHIRLRTNQNYNLAALTPNNRPIDPSAILADLDAAR